MYAEHKHQKKHQQEVWVGMSWKGWEKTFIVLCELLYGFVQLSLQDGFCVLTKWWSLAH